ncbi:hypothetical protein FACS1894214_3480 [Planctomycetales bacterium]|nr:hypothetical protein FACS1894214_3480 [Planctomycetales bacterium]
MVNIIVYTGCEFNCRAYSYNWDGSGDSYVYDNPRPENRSLRIYSSRSEYIISPVDWGYWQSYEWRNGYVVGTCCTPHNSGSGGGGSGSGDSGGITYNRAYPCDCGGEYTSDINYVNVDGYTHTTFKICDTLYKMPLPAFAGSYYYSQGHDKCATGADPSMQGFSYFAGDGSTNWNCDRCDPNAYCGGCTSYYCWHDNKHYDETGFELTEVDGSDDYETIRSSYSQNDPYVKPWSRSVTRRYVGCPGGTRYDPCFQGAVFGGRQYIAISSHRYQTQGHSFEVYYIDKDFNLNLVGTSPKSDWSNQQFQGLPVASQQYMDDVGDYCILYRHVDGFAGSAATCSSSIGVGDNILVGIGAYGQLIRRTEWDNNGYHYTKILSLCAVADLYRETSFIATVPLEYCVVQTAYKLTYVGAGYCNFDETDCSGSSSRNVSQLGSSTSYGRFSLINVDTTQALIYCRGEEVFTVESWEAPVGMYGDVAGYPVAFSGNNCCDDYTELILYDYTPPPENPNDGSGSGESGGSGGGSGTFTDNGARVIYYKKAIVASYNSADYTVSVNCCGSGAIITWIPAGGGDGHKELWSSGNQVGTLTGYAAQTVSLQCVGEVWHLFTWDDQPLLLNTINMAGSTCWGDNLNPQPDWQSFRMYLIDGTECIPVSTVHHPNPSPAPGSTGWYCINQWKCTIGGKEFQFSYDTNPFSSSFPNQPVAINERQDELVVKDFAEHHHALWCGNGTVVTDDNRITEIQAVRYDARYPGTADNTLPYGSPIATHCGAYIIENPAKLKTAYANSFSFGELGGGTNTDAYLKRVLEMPHGARGFWIGADAGTPAINTGLYKRPIKIWGQNLEEWKNMYPSLGLYLASISSYDTEDGYPSYGTPALLTAGMGSDDDVHIEYVADVYTDRCIDYIHVSDYYAPSNFRKLVADIEEAWVSQPFNGSKLHASPYSNEWSVPYGKRDTSKRVLFGGNGKLSVWESYNTGGDTGDGGSVIDRFRVFNAYNFNCVSGDCDEPIPLLQSPMPMSAAPMSSRSLTAVSTGLKLSSAARTATPREAVRAAAQQGSARAAVRARINTYSMSNISSPVEATRLGGSSSGGCGCGKK